MHIRISLNNHHCLKPQLEFAMQEIVLGEQKTVPEKHQQDNDHDEDDDKMKMKMKLKINLEMSIQKNMQMKMM